MLLKKKKGHRYNTAEVCMREGAREPILEAAFKLILRWPCLLMTSCVSLARSLNLSEHRFLSSGLYRQQQVPCRAGRM
jgi:hypothetical protein